MNRRLVLKMLAATSLGDFAVSATAGSEDQILELDCTDLLARIRDGSLRAEQLCASFLQQYECQRSLNVVTWIDPANVLSRARDVDRARDKDIRAPALAGLPILVKDNIDTVGFPTSAGTSFLGHHFPRRNALVVERLLEQGAIVMGKANMHELAMGPTSSNPTFGFVRNPYGPDFIPGGSSGGSAAAIAARIVPAALGTDTAGSVRIPAAYCGIVGFRPSTYPRKLYSQQGVVPLTLDFDTIGPMGRSVADVAMLHATIVDRPLVRPGCLKNVRIGVPRLAYWDDLDSEVERVVRAALTRLRDQGAVLVEIDLREVNDVAWQIMLALISREEKTDLENYLCTQEPSISLRDLAEQIASRDVRAAVGKKGDGRRPNPDPVRGGGDGRDALRAAYRAVFREHGIQGVIFPTQVLPPLPIRASGDDPDEMIEFNGRMVSKALTIFRNTVPSVVLGAPALSLPAGLTSNGLPVGVELDGLPGNDSDLLALGQTVEAAIGRLPAPRHVVRR